VGALILLWFRRRLSGIVERLDRCDGNGVVYEIPHGTVSPHVKYSVEVLPAASFKKTVGDPTGLAELMVFYCECAAGFCNDVGYQDEAYFDALVRMFEQSLKTVAQLSDSDPKPLIIRLDRVRIASHNFGYGIGDDMDPCSPGIG
jgi:hypothetical protein